MMTLQLKFKQHVEVLQNLLADVVLAVKCYELVVSYKGGATSKSIFLLIAPIMISLDRHHISLFFFLILSLIIIPHHQIQFFAQISINSRQTKFRKSPTSQPLKYTYTTDIPSFSLLILILNIFFLSDFLNSRTIPSYQNSVPLASNLNALSTERHHLKCL